MKSVLNDIKQFVYINNLCTSGYTTDEILGINSFENIIQVLDSEKSILCCCDQFGDHILLLLFS